MPGTTICVDANIVVRLVVDAHDERIQELWEAWEREGRPIVAPELLRYEVTNALFQYQRHGVFSAETARHALNAARALPIRLLAAAELDLRALALAQRFALPATNDAYYLAAAERSGAELWTSDARLLNAVQEELAWVRLWR